MKGERRLGRFTCSEVLLRLASFLDGTLPAGELAEVRVHVGGCDRCARFGGEYAATVAALREPAAGADSDDLADTLLSRLEPR
jgi:anti-sigma factor RsiW